MSKTYLRYEPKVVTPPGQTIRDLLEEQGRDDDTVARDLNMTPEALDSLIHGKLRLSHDIAENLGRLFEVSAEFWIRREEDYRKYLDGVSE